MPNPLADYVHALPPYFDFTDARTWYDGLWDRGLWPPEGYPGVGMRGIGESLPGGTYPPAYFPGDWARLRVASLRGLGNGQVIVNLNSPAGTVDLTNCDQATIDAYNAGLIPPPVCAAPTTTNTASTIRCLSGTGPLEPGQSYCPPSPTNPNQLSTQTVVMIAMGVGVVMLFILAARRR